MSTTVEARLQRIAEAHFKYVDEHGGSYGECVECQLPHPCPTYVWATTERNAAVDCWDPADEEDERTA